MSTSSGPQRSPTSIPYSERSSRPRYGSWRCARLEIGRRITLSGAPRRIQLFRAARQHRVLRRPARAVVGIRHPRLDQLTGQLRLLRFQRSSQDPRFLPIFTFTHSQPRPFALNIQAAEPQQPKGSFTQWQKARVPREPTFPAAAQLLMWALKLLMRVDSKLLWGEIQHLPPLQHVVTLDLGNDARDSARLLPVRRKSSIPVSFTAETSRNRPQQEVQEEQGR